MRSTRLLSWSRRLFGLGSVPAPPHVFALGPDRLAYGRFVPSDGGFSFLEFQEVELPAESVQPGPLGGPLRDPAAFRGALRLLLERISGPVDQASLVLPDPWLRVSFAEVGELPPGGEAREDVLRWKLRRLVPFRVDELRLRGVEVSPLPGQDEERRVMLGFAIELLLDQLEGAFTAEGIHLGRVANRSLSLLAAVAAVAAGEELAALVLVDGPAYALVFSRRGEPVLHRFKTLGTGLPEAPRARLVERDLRLTRSFLAQGLPEAALGRVILAAPAAEQERWLGWLARGLGASPEPLGLEHLPVNEGDPAAPWAQVAPLLGAACREVR